MLSKEILRKKFSLIRKKKYFEVKENFFSPILRMIKTNNLRNIACYYPSNYELSTFKLFKLLNSDKKISILLPCISNGFMKFVKWNLQETLKVNNFGFLALIDPDVKNDIILIQLLESINDSKISTRGKIDFRPFFFNINFVVDKMNLSRIFDKKFLVHDLINNDIYFHKNFNGNLTIDINNLTKNKQCLLLQVKMVWLKIEFLNLKSYTMKKY